MKTLINIFLVIPSILPKGKASVEMYNNSGVAVVAFFAFLVILYLIISSGNTKKSGIRNK